MDAYCKVHKLHSCYPEWHKDDVRYVDGLESVNLTLTGSQLRDIIDSLTDAYRMFTRIASRNEGITVSQTYYRNEAIKTASQIRYLCDLVGDAYPIR